MSVPAAELTVMIAGAYLGVGVLFALLFEAFGLGATDPAARGAGWGFRVLIFPALAALWPIMAARWVGAAFGGGGDR